MNIERRGEWNKVDPKDAQIMALTTALKESGANKSVPVENASGPGEDTVPGMSPLKLWRTVFKGDTIVKDGVTYYWCTKHKYEGHYDGLYYSNHKTSTHDEWRANKRSKRRGTNPGGAGTGSKTTAAAKPEQSLKIPDTLRTALCTNFCISEEDMDKVFKDNVQEN